MPNYQPLIEWLDEVGARCSAMRNDTLTKNRILLDDFIELKDSLQTLKDIIEYQIEHYDA